MASILARSVRLAATLRPRLLVVQPPGQAMMSKLSKAVLARPVRLNEIADNPGAHTPRTRVGRGVGSGKGKTAGRGHKGQNARRGGGVRLGFEGGQTPLYRRIPKRGFTNAPFKEELQTLNLDRLQQFLDWNRLDKSKVITMNSLYWGGIVTSCKVGVKLLGNLPSGKFKHKIDIEVSKASKSAIEAIEKAGGTIKAVYYNRLGLRVLYKPYKFHPLRTPRFAKPVKAKDIAYYRSYENRGYLAQKPDVQTSDTV